MGYVPEYSDALHGDELTGIGSAVDCHFRIGGAKGTGLQNANCPKLSGTVKQECIAGSLILHLGRTAGAYLENVWMWYA